GGMGTVWLARRTDGQGDERAAVKFLNLALASVAGKERFRREGAMLTRLDHPAIARLFDAGLTRTGQPFLVLEYVDGVRIDAYVETQQLSLDERMRLVLQVLAAVGHPTAEGARAPADTLRALMEVQPVPVAPPALDAILAKALRKSPSERYQTVSAFAQDLGRFLGDP